MLGMPKERLLKIRCKEFEKPRFLRLLVVLLLRGYLHILIKFRFKMEGSLPKGPKIFAINHPTATDPFLIGTIFPNAKILITKDAFNSKIANWVLSKLGHIPVDRENGMVAYNRAKETLLSGQDIIIFPEGTLSSKLYTMNQIKTGLTRLALETKAPIVPIGVSLKKRGLIEWRMKSKTGDRYLARWYIFNKYFVNIGKSIKLKGSLNNKKHIYKKSAYLKEEIQRLSRKYFYKTEVLEK
jgi:1-acyl-sn-glycerol-3-phosphate acyltransferase